MDLTVPPLADLAVSLYLPGGDRAADDPHSRRHAHGLHRAGQRHRPGDAQASATTTAYLWLSGVDVLASGTTGAIVAFGDSITDGVGATPDSQSRLAVAPGRKARVRGVAAAERDQPRDSRGIVCCGTGFGVSALTRFDRDVLGSGRGPMDDRAARHQRHHVSGGIRECRRRKRSTADDVIWGLRQIVERAHAHGIKVAGATIMPVGGVSTYTEGGEAIRQAVNRWIRTSGAYDAVIDFDCRRPRSGRTRSGCGATSIPAITCIPTTPGTQRWRPRSIPRCFFDSASRRRTVRRGAA